MDLLSVTFLLLGTGILFQLLCVCMYIVSKLTLSRCTCNTYLAGKTALVTGGNSGLGFQTALALAGRGCRVIIADKDNCDDSKQKIQKETGNENIVTKQFDLASLKSIRRLAEEINKTESRLDILINNAGAAGLGNQYTDDKLNKGIQVNHFGSFLLTHLLIDLLKKSAPSRIIFVSSLLAFTNNLSLKNLNAPTTLGGRFLSELFVYSNTKLCNIITTRQLSKKLAGTGVTVNALHPGVVTTSIYNKSMGEEGFLLKLFYYCLSYYAKNLEEGSQTIIHLALSKELEDISGKYFAECRPIIEPRKVYDIKFCESIWEASETYVNLLPNEKI